MMALLMAMPVMSALSQSRVVNDRPIIGLSCANGDFVSQTGKNYSESIKKAGGAPVLLPIISDSVALRNIIGTLDALILIGGEDVAPAYYKEENLPELGKVDPERDTYDMLLAKIAKDMCLPVLGICRGCQLLNIFYGGTLYQDLPSQRADTTIHHRQKESAGVATHSIKIVPGSRIAGIFGPEDMMVNTFHHQAVKDLAPGFEPAAWAPDGVLEAMEAKNGLPILGVQFHPEGLYNLGGSERAAKIFKWLLDEARVYRHARNLHEKCIALDTHTDTTLGMMRGRDFGKRDDAQVTLPKLIEGGVSAQYLGCWVRQEELTLEGCKKAYDRVESLIDEAQRQVSKFPQYCELAKSVDDVKRIKADGKIAILLGVENGYAIGSDLNVLKHYVERGITYVTLCHLKNNGICDSSSDKEGAKWNGLSPFGKKVVKQMNKLGLVIDLSHASEKSFYDVLKLTKKPVMCSHSSSRSVCDHNRNITDDQARALAQNGGVIQVCPLRAYVTKDAKNARLDDYINHICHLVEVAGVDHVGIGTDFDGGARMPGFNGSNEYMNVTMRLVKRGFSDEDIAKLLGGNYLRVLAAVQAVK